MSALSTRRGVIEIELNGGVRVRVDGGVSQAALRPVQVDGFVEYAVLCGDGRVVEAACMVRARRKFLDAHETTKSAAHPRSATPDRCVLCAVPGSLSDDPQVSHAL